MNNCNITKRPGMKKHLSKHEIIELVLREDRGQNLNHIRECDICKTEYESLLSLIRTSDNTGIVPSDQLEYRILRTYRGIKENKTQSSVFTFPLTRIIASAAAVIIIILSSILYLSYKGQENQAVQISINDTYEASDNKSSVVKETVINEGSVVSTEDKKGTVLLFKEYFTIKLAENTTLKIERALMNKGLNKYDFAFNLEAGSISADFSHNTSEMLYSFRTRDAYIHSAGTEFLLTVLKDGTRLDLIKGELTILSLTSGDELTAGAGYSYIIASSIRTEKTGKAGITAVKEEKENKAKDKSGKDSGKQENKINEVKEESTGNESDAGKNESVREARSEIKAAQKEIRNLKKETRALKRAKKDK